MHAAAGVRPSTGGGLLSLGVVLGSGQRVKHSGEWPAGV